MKQLFNLFAVALMVAAISVAGCGDKKEGGGDTKTDDAKGSEKKDDNASMPSPSANGMVATKVSLPEMDWA